MGPCPTPPDVKKDHDVAKYTGLWYEFYQPKEFQYRSERECASRVYLAPSNSTEGPQNTFISYTNVQDIVGNKTYAINRVQTCERGACKYGNSPWYENNYYYVLRSNHYAYSIVWTCSSLAGLRHEEHLWVITREKFPSKFHRLEIKKNLEELGYSKKTHLKKGRLYQCWGEDPPPTDG